MMLYTLNLEAVDKEHRACIPCLYSVYACEADRNVQVKRRGYSVWHFFSLDETLNILNRYLSIANSVGKYFSSAIFRPKPLEVPSNNARRQSEQRKSGRLRVILRDKNIAFYFSISKLQCTAHCRLHHNHKPLCRHYQTQHNLTSNHCSWLPFTQWLPFCHQMNLSNTSTKSIPPS